MTVVTHAPALDVDGLTVDIRTPSGTVRAVDGVSFGARSGRTLALLGESGCGKSLTAQALVGLLEPVASVSGGAVRLAGTDLVTAGRAARRRLAGPGLAIVFQDALTALNPVYTVGTQLAEPFRIHSGMSRRAARAEAVRLMGRVGIPSPETRVDAYPHQFSGGMRQRLLIAMAVALNPAVLLADEPTTALDVTVQAQIMQLLRELRTERDMAVVLITHDLALVAEEADDVVVMYAGTVVEAGPVAEVFSRPHHPYTRGLLDSVPARVPKGVPLASIGGSPPELRAIPAACVYQDRCPLVQDVCRARRPAERADATGRRVACHRAGELGFQEVPS
ncbi:ABC transporter ATP-binding protein [Kineococcus sp. SYSU DK002]|uniref:ABC transporter ATP-binding protein n=1 Tax=Kineococcus sp. SYSU DK002 TaxID=3383123 RepID=UPI003D7D0317